MNKLLLLIFVISLNYSFGQVTWQKYYDYNHNIDYGGDAQITFDKGFINAGETNSGGGTIRDVRIIKCDSLGDTLWTRIYDANNNFEYPSIKQTYDSGYILLGTVGLFSGYPS